MRSTMALSYYNFKRRTSISQRISTALAEVDTEECNDSTIQVSMVDHVVLESEQYIHIIVFCALFVNPLVIHCYMSSFIHLLLTLIHNQPHIITYAYAATKTA